MALRKIQSCCVASTAKELSGCDSPRLICTVQCNYILDFFFNMITTFCIYIFIGFFPLQIGWYYFVCVPVLFFVWESV